MLVTLHRSLHPFHQVLELVVQSKVDVSLVGNLARKHVEHLHHEEYLVDECQVLVFICSCVRVVIKELLLVPKVWACLQVCFLFLRVVSLSWAIAAVPEEASVEVNVDENQLLVDHGREHIDLHWGCKNLILLSVERACMVQNWLIVLAHKMLIIYLFGSWHLAG